MAAVVILLAAPLLSPGTACRADEPRREHAWLTLAEGWTQLLLRHPEQAGLAFDKVIACDHRGTLAYVGRGWLHAQSKLWCLADHDFSRAIEIEPHSAVLRYLRASLYYRQHRLPEALIDCEAALRLAPRLAPLHLLVAAIHWARKDYDRSLAACERALELCPENAEAHLLRGMIHGRKGNLDAALADLSCALEQSPSAFTYKLRARLRLRKWGLEAALADLDQALRREPRDIEALVLRSGIHLVRRTYSQAVADCDMALRVNPGCGAAYANRGAAQFKQGERDLALTDFNRAIRLNPLDLESLGNRAQLYARMGRWDKVIADSTAILRQKPGWKKYRQLRLHASLQQDDLLTAQEDVAFLVAHAVPSDPGGYEERGDLYVLQTRLMARASNHAGQAEECFRNALRDYSKAIELQPDWTQNHCKNATAKQRLKQHGEGFVKSVCKQAAIHLQLGEYAEAIASSSTVLWEQPDNKQALIVRLQAFKAKKDILRALEDCTQLIRLCADTTERRQWLGERACLAEDQGDEEEAEADYSEYVHLDPRDPEGWQRRAGYFSRHGEERQAVKDLDQALRLQHSKAAPEGRAGLHLQRARLLIRTGDLRDALEDYAELVRLLPYWSKLHFERALLLALVGDYPQAVQSGWRGCRLVLEHSLRHSRAATPRHEPARGETSGPATVPESGASSAAGWLR
jgi:tetratricopeptide (TPR) repeat protein